MPDVLQAYTSEFRQKSTTFVMACSIVGMMGHSGTFDAGEAHRVAENLVGTSGSSRGYTAEAHPAGAAQPERYSLCGAAGGVHDRAGAAQPVRHSRHSAAGAAQPARHSWRVAAGRAQPARHSWRGTSPRSIVALSEKHIKSSANPILCVPDSVLCTARWDGKRPVEGDEECSCIGPDCVVKSSTVSSGGCWTSNSSHLLDGFWGQRWQCLVGLTDILCFSARTCWFFAGFAGRAGQPDGMDVLT